MDFDDALLLIEEQIESPERFNLNTLAIALPVVASHPDGYSGTVWEYGSKVLKLAQQTGISPIEAFEKIGWGTFKSALCSGISQKDIIRALSFVQYDFIHPAHEVRTILNDVRIRAAITDGLKVQKHPFIQPSDFGLLTTSGQNAFAELLTVIDNLEVDDELRLQWSASALRFGLPNSRSYIVASEVLIKTLIRNQRYYSGYYLFRALSENCDELWNSYISLELIKVLIDEHSRDNCGAEILTELCIDRDIQNKRKTNTDLRFLIGILSVHLWSAHKVVDAETVAWELPLMIQSDYSNLASLLASYITDGKLPELPPQFANVLEKLEAELCILIGGSENELRERTYRGVQLAVKIHRDILKNYFLPVLENIKHSKNAIKILDQIRKLDPEDLISTNDNQRKSNFQIEGKLLQQMIKDNRDIKKSLEKTAQMLKQIQDIQHERSLIAVEQFELYEEFQLFCEAMPQAALRAFELLIPDLWKTLNKGLDVYKREGDQYGTR
jgi:hypothetical protein